MFYALLVSERSMTIYAIVCVALLLVVVFRIDTIFFPKKQKPPKERPGPKRIYYR